MSFLHYLRIAIRESMAAAAEEFAANSDTLREATDIGTKRSRETETSIFVWEQDISTGFTVKGSDSSFVVLTEGLVESLGDEETEAVVQHELAHADGQDASNFFLLGAVLTVLPFVAARVVDKRVGRLAGLLALSVGQLFGVLAMRWISRRRELDADEQAAEEMGSPEPMARALYRLADETNQPVEYRPVVEVFATHPAIKNRVSALTEKSRDELMK